MEGLVAAAQDFLADAAALEAARAVDAARADSLPELRDAFLDFRDADESLGRLVERVQGHLSRLFEPPAGGPARNLWGFRTEEESRFAAHFTAAAPRLPEVDLASLFRSYLKDPTRDEERIQVLLAFGEFVAGLDARGEDGDPRLGVGPAAHFLTLAWHCLSQGKEPVFTFAADRAIRAVARLGGLGSDRLEGRDWEPRFTTFYEVARELARATQGERPGGMREGWAVEHALNYALARISRTGELAAAGDPGGSGSWRPRPPSAKPVIVGPSSKRGGDEAAPPPVTIETPRAAAPRVEEPAEEVVERARPQEPPAPDPAAETPRARERDFRAIARSKARVEKDDAWGTRSGVELEEALPPDRTPPAQPRPGTQPEPPVEAEAAEPTQAEDPPRRKRPTVRIVEPERWERTGVPLEELLPPDRLDAAPASERPARRAPGDEPTLGDGPRRDEAPEKTAAQLQREARMRNEAELERRLRDISDEERRRLPESAEGEIDEDVEVSGEGEVDEDLDVLSGEGEIDEDVEVLSGEGEVDEDLAGADAAPFAPGSSEPEPAPAARRAPEASVAPAAAPQAVAVAALDDEGSDAAEVGVEDLLSEFRREVVHTSRGEPTGEVQGDRLARDLHLGSELADELLAALDERGRLLLVGPPQTGKTYVARRVAIHVAGHTDRVLFLRLHPGLTYEALMGGGEERGVLRAFCERAQEDRDHRYVVVLDELDRGDAAAALGELLGALTERGQPIRLGSGDAFFVSRNLRVLATAREDPTDPALVGRFPTVELPADPAVLRRFLAGYRPALEWVADMLAALNRTLAEGRAQPVQVGHGFFMDVDLDVARLRRIWAREVLPLLRSLGAETAGLDYDSLKPRA